MPVLKRYKPHGGYPLAPDGGWATVRKLTNREAVLILNASETMTERGPDGLRGTIAGKCFVALNRFGRPKAGKWNQAYPAGTRAIYHHGGGGGVWSGFYIIEKLKTLEQS